VVIIVLQVRHDICDSIVHLLTCLEMLGFFRVRLDDPEPAEVRTALRQLFL
jgi:hypothetical protein